MAGFTLTNVATFPNGTEVKAYPETNWVNSQVNQAAAPVGSATSTQTMTGSTLTFTGLTPGTRYVAHAQVGGVHRYVGFFVGSSTTEGRSRGLFEANTDYEGGDIVIHEAVAYYATAAFTSGSTFDAQDWSPLPTGVAGISPAEKGVASGVATLGVDGKVPAAQLPASDTPSAVVLPFTYPGELAVGAGTKRLYLPTAGVIESVEASVGTAPDGTAVIVDVHKNGSTLFTTQANRPTIAPSTFTSGQEVPAVTSFAQGDYLTVDIDQVGSEPAVGDPTFVSDTDDLTGTTNPGAGGNYSVNRPAGIQSGDFHLVSLRSLATGGGAAFGATPAGWTLLEFQDIADFHVYYYYRLDTGSAGPWDFPVSQAGNVIARHAIYRGVHQTTPVDASSSRMTANDAGPHSPAALTTTVVDTLIVYRVALGNNRTATLPTGYTARTNFDGSTSASRHLADKAQATAATIDTSTFTLSGAARAVPLRVALRRPAAGGGEWTPGEDLTLTLFATLEA